MRQYVVFSVLTILFIFTISAVQANIPTAEEKGKQIINKVIEQDNGFADFNSKVEMVTTDVKGNQSVRKMKVSNLEVSESGEKRLFTFNYPRDVKGTAVLLHTANKSEKRWIFLPAFKRVKRISSANKSSPFVGSEFSYEDLTSVELEKYQYRFLKMENYNGKECFVVEMTPTYKNSGYKRQIAYVDSTEYIFRRIAYYDRKGELLKSLELEDYELFIDRYWRPLSLSMINHQNDKKTLMLWRDVKYHNGLTDRDLSVSALKRSR